MKTKTIKTLREINKRVYRKYKDKLEVEVDNYETTLKIIDHFSQEDVYKTLDKEQKEALDKMIKAKEAGLLSGTKMVANLKEVEKFNKELDLEIDKAIKSGELPDPKNDTELKAFNKKIKKINKKNNDKK
jgi:hypothetical protein